MENPHDRVHVAKDRDGSVREVSVEDQPRVPALGVGLGDRGLEGETAACNQVGTSPEQRRLRRTIEIQTRSVFAELGSQGEEAAVEQFGGLFELFRVERQICLRREPKASIARLQLRLLARDVMTHQSHDDNDEGGSGDQRCGQCRARRKPRAVSRSKPPQGRRSADETVCGGLQQICPKSSQGGDE